MNDETNQDPSTSASSRRLSAFLVLGCLLTGCGWLTREATIVYMTVNSQLSDNRLELEINRSFIEEYKNRVTIITSFTVDRAMAAPFAGALDGDLHFAGRSPQVVLPIVAEIANAVDEKAAIDLVHRAARTHKPLQITGMWRIWPEHAGKVDEEQGDSLPAYESANPDHVFELHPVTWTEGVSLLESLKPVAGFVPGDARRTFGIYEKVPCMLRVKHETVSIVTETGLYNDVEFIMKLADDPQLEVSDGRFVIASATDLDGNLLVEHLRMVFAKGTPPERAVRHLKGGDHLHVYGIPRMDFAEISRRVTHRHKDPALLTRTLPYEILIIGVYPK